MLPLTSPNAQAPDQAEQQQTDCLPGAYALLGHVGFYRSLGLS